MTMSSQLYYHVHFTHMFIPSPVFWVVNSPAPEAFCSLTFLVWLPGTVALRSMFGTALLWAGARFVDVVFGVAPAAAALAPRGLICHKRGLVHGYETFAAAPARCTSPLKEVMGVLFLFFWILLPQAHALGKKKGKKNSCKHMTSSHSFTDESCNSHYPTVKWMKLLPQWLQELTVDL